MMLRSSHLLVGSLACTALAGCAPDVAPLQIRNLDRPTAVAFGCVGDLRLVEDGTADPDDEVISSAQPLSSCTSRAEGVVPPGQEDLEGSQVVEPRTYGLVLQPTRGTVAVVDVQALAVLDSDPLSPGKNSIPIGSLPVSLVTDPSGCYAVSANAGSCDLSALDIGSAVSLIDEASAIRRAVTTPAGEVVLAKPRQMVVSPGFAVDQVGAACPEAPVGLLYIAYPSCHAVAVVDAGTGEIVSAIELAEDGTAQVTAGELACPAQCGARPSPIALGPGPVDAGVDAGVADAGMIDAGPGQMPPDVEGTPRPVDLALSPDGRSLYVVAENSPRLTTVQLDADGLPVATSQVAVAGDVGLTGLAATGPLAMGGSIGRLSGTAGSFEFVYAIATDRTIRVVEPSRGFECDTQVDPRYTRSVSDLALLQCFPVGDSATPPRRAGARSPGIHLPAGAAPLDVAFATLGLEIGEGDPGAPDSAMVGHFAFITASNGAIYVANVDDDAYADQEQSQPLATFMPLVMAHQLRDIGRARSQLSQACSSPDDDPLSFGPRLVEDVSQLITAASIAPEKGGLLPALRQVSCTEEGSGGNEVEVAVSELSFAAPAAVREAAFPDLAATESETWRIIWEGPLSVDSTGVDIDGQQVRAGTIDTSDDSAQVNDGGAPFCAMGAEPYDILEIVGCNPQRGDSDCGLGETCYTHPDSPAEITTGLCLPAEFADALAGRCRELLISRREYSILETYADHVVIAPRRRVLRTSPVAGCQSDAQCEDLAAYTSQLSLAGHPVDLADQDQPMTADYQWVCAADPSRAPGPDRCQMACADSTECEAGYACIGGFCAAGPLPDEQCVERLVRYQVRVGDAFSVIGSQTGFVHNRTVDPTTGACVDDPDASPLSIGRLPLSAPACTGDGIADVSPNPCETTVTHTETVQHFDLQNGVCIAGDEAVETREATAIRFRNPVLTFHLVDPVTSGDAQCRGDGAGTRPPHAVVFPGYQMVFETVGGVFPMFVPTDSMAYPVAILPGPTGRLWVLDQGDAAFGVRGQVVTFAPGAFNQGFRPITIQ